jgi:ferritin
MLSERMTEALNRQINNELYSAYLYMALSSYAGQIGLKGGANWFKIQAQEEMTHALKIYNYVTSQGNHAVMLSIDEPPAIFNGVQEMFEKTLEHEQFITKCIHELVELARDEKDHATEIMLQWFVTEQVEEEEGVNEILDELKLAGEGGGGLYMIDKQLGARVFTPPPEGI